MAHKKKKEPRNPIVLACLVRYGQTTKVMKDRRDPRGGNRNKQRDYSEGQYLLHGLAEEGPSDVGSRDRC